MRQELVKGVTAHCHTPGGESCLAAMSSDDWERVWSVWFSYSAQVTDLYEKFCTQGMLTIAALSYHENDHFTSKNSIVAFIEKVHTQPLMSENTSNCEANIRAFLFKKRGTRKRLHDLKIFSIFQALRLSTLKSILIVKCESEDLTGSRLNQSCDLVKWRICCVMPFNDKYSPKRN